MFACGQKVGVNAITSVIPTGIRTAENTRLKASNALSSRTRPVAFLTKRFRLPAGGMAPARHPAVGTVTGHKHRRHGHEPRHTYAILRQPDFEVNKRLIAGMPHDHCGVCGRRSRRAVPGGPPEDARLPWVPQAHGTRNLIFINTERGRPRLHG